jgi:type IV pilus assembly protein PilB
MKNNLIIKKKIGEIVVKQGLITPEQLIQFLRTQKETGKPLGRVLIEEGILTQEELTCILMEQLGIPQIWLRKGLIDARIVNVLPKDKALRFQVIPMFRVNNVLTLATADPHSIFVLNEISRITNLVVQPVLCRTDDILEAIYEYYREDVNFDEVINQIDDSKFELVQAITEKETTELAEMAEDSPVVNLANAILLKAIRDGASDIHIEPQRKKSRILVRIDGLLYEFMSPKIEMHAPIVSRLKIMGNLDIAERRMPQDGRIQVRVDGRTVDLRFGSMPGIYGEKVVLRILDKEKAVLDLNRLGFDTVVLKRFKSLLKRPHGLILVCGPTGSGKTTTLYSAITMLKCIEKNIITIEDPVEYQLDNINQNQIKDSIGLSFAKFLKHAVRQDPDIILVGEIRDRETAEIAIQASLTGHLVLSSLHTNDSPSAITRLLEMGVEPYLISSSLIACQAQRLVRTICPECKTSYYPSQGELMELGIDQDKKIRLSKGMGCSACYDSGFKGRIGIYELLEMDEGLQSLILENPNNNAIKKYLSKNGYQRLKDLGYEKVIQGSTHIEEIRRIASGEI